MDQESGFQARRYYGQAETYEHRDSCGGERTGGGKFFGATINEAGLWKENRKQGGRIIIPTRGVMLRNRGSFLDKRPGCNGEKKVRLGLNSSIHYYQELGEQKVQRGSTWRVSGLTTDGEGNHTESRKRERGAEARKKGEKSLAPSCQGPKKSKMDT